MKVAVFSSKPYDREFLTAANRAIDNAHELRFLEARLSPETAQLGQDSTAVCAFVNDALDRTFLRHSNPAG